MALTYTQAEVLEASHKHFMDSFFTAMPGIVVSYDSATQTADVQPAVKTRYEDEEGNQIVEEEPIVPCVPVIFPGAGSASITWPVAKGDSVLLVVSSLPLDTWIALGGVVDPRAYWRNHLSDCVAIPGLRSFKGAIKPAPPSNALVVTAPSGGTVKLGSASASEAVAVQSALDIFCQALVSAAVSLASNPANAQAALALTTLANELFSGGFNPLDPPTSFSLWSAGTSRTKAD